MELKRNVLQENIAQLELAQTIAVPINAFNAFHIFTLACFFQLRFSFCFLICLFGFWRVIVLCFAFFLRLILLSCETVLSISSCLQDCVSLMCFFLLFRFFGFWALSCHAFALLFLLFLLSWNLRIVCVSRHYR